MSTRPLHYKLWDAAFAYARGVLNGETAYTNANLQPDELCDIALAFPEFLDLSPVIQGNSVISRQMDAEQAAIFVGLTQKLSHTADPILYAVDFVLSLQNGLGGVANAIKLMECARNNVVYVFQAFLLRCGVQTIVRAQKVFIYNGLQTKQVALNDTDSIFAAGMLRQFDEPADFERAAEFLSRIGACTIIRQGNWFTDCDAVHRMIAALQKRFPGVTETIV